MLTHGNQKDPCLFKLFIVGFAIIYYVVYLFRKVDPNGLGGGLQDELDTIGWAGVGSEGATTLGGCCMGTLG